MSDPEICICSAVRLDDGRIIRGHRHNHCIKVAMEWANAGQEVGRLTQEQQGFVTSRNRYVTRKEGARLMAEIGWVSRADGRLIRVGDDLYSEDLY
jgi:hypothetical protein